MAALQHTPSLVCPACGRHITASDADLKETAAPAYCPSCGTVAAPASFIEEATDAAATQRMTPPDIVEEVTAILAPPSGAASPEASASTHRETLERIGEATPLLPNRYPTTSATQPVNASDISGPSQDPRTQPIDKPATTPVDEPPVTLVPETADSAPEGVIPQRDGWRNPWLIGSVIIFLLVLFVGGILLSQAPGSATSSVPQVTPLPSATSTSPATLTPGYTRVEDASGLYSFAVPANWTPLQRSSSNAELTIYTDPSHGVTFEVESFPASNGQSGAALDNLVLASSFAPHSVSNIGAPTTTSLAGATWIKVTANLTLQQNGTTQPKNVVVQTTTVNGTTFIIFYSSPTDAAVDADAQALPSILDSFTFLG